MAKSVKLKEADTFIDTDGIYDFEQKKTQKEINNSVLGKLSKFVNEIKFVFPSACNEGTTFDVDIPSGAIVISIIGTRSDNGFKTEMLNANMCGYCNYVSDTKFRVLFSSVQNAYNSQPGVLRYIENLKI